ncbi:hypothetical protein GBAR_LOCUS26945, partial [Geodia barretti]
TATLSITLQINDSKAVIGIYRLVVNWSSFTLKETVHWPSVSHLQSGRTRFWRETTSSL